MKTVLMGLAIGLAMAMPAAADGDASKGKTVFKKCSACHTVDGKNRVGPTLMDVIGRPVASLADFKYSPAMTAFAAGDKVWTAELMAEYLIAPRQMVTGTTMAFAGLKKPEEIADLIAYLQNPADAK